MRSVLPRVDHALQAPTFAPQLHEERGHEFGLLGDLGVLTRQEVAGILKCSVRKVDDLRARGKLLAHPELPGRFTLRAVRLFLECHASSLRRRVA